MKTKAIMYVVAAALIISLSSFVDAAFYQSKVQHTMFGLFSAREKTTVDVETVYQFTVNDLSGQPVQLSDYKGKVLLIVNTASKCGLTPQLKGLEALYQKYKDKGLVVLGFPSNDFGGQEPLVGDQIQEFCTKNYGVTFPVFDKVVVKGDGTCPLYQFLCDEARNGKVSSKPMWNFHKYLIDRDGKVQDFFISSTAPDAERLQKAIEALL